MRLFSLQSRVLSLSLLAALTACGSNSTPGLATGSISGTLYPLGAAASSGEYIVRWQGGLGAQALTHQSLDALTVQGQRLQRGRALGLPDTYLYKAEQALGAEQAQAVMSSLASLPGVLSVEPNLKLRALKTSDDKLVPYQWAQTQLNLPAAWDITTGSAVTVAVLDTGIVKHPDLVAKLLPGADLISDPASAGDGDGPDQDPTDLGKVYHGTHVAGIIGASSNNGIGIAGVSWGAKILPIRVLGVDGLGNTDDIIQGLLWAGGQAVDGLNANPNPAKVINLSLGGPAACSPALQAVLNWLYQKNITVVVASGNENVSADTYTPASCPHVITVGATGPDGKRAFYSNYGQSVDLVAPGGNPQITFTVNGQQVAGNILSTIYDPKTQSYSYGMASGTSMAAPHVAGVAALMLSQDSALTPDLIEARLKASATKLSCDVPDGCGSGLVNAAAALKSTVVVPPDPTPNPNPTNPTPSPSDQAVVVAALYQRSDGSFDLSQSQRLRLSLGSGSLPYVLNRLTSGSYIVAAWQDANSNQAVDAGEPFAQSSGAVSVGASSITGIDLRLTKATSQNAVTSALTALVK